MQEKTAYLEALRYFANAKETLKLAKKDDYVYTDVKYVKTACGTAYNGVLIAVEHYLKGKEGLKFKRPKSIEEFRTRVGKQNKSLLKMLNHAYETLHIHGYYFGTTAVSTVTDGFQIGLKIVQFAK